MNYTKTLRKIYLMKKVEEIIRIITSCFYGNDGSVSNQEYVQLRNELAEYIKSYGRSAFNFIL